MQKPGIEEVVRKAWEIDCEGSAIVKVAAKIKNCRVELLKWSRQQQGNLAKKIKRIQGAMDRLKEEGDQRDWSFWNSLKIQLNEAYEEEEMFWSQKARKQWLLEGDKKPSTFMYVQSRGERLIRLSCWKKNWGELPE